MENFIGNCVGIVHCDLVCRSARCWALGRDVGRGRSHPTASGPYNGWYVCECAIFDVFVDAHFGAVGGTVAVCTVAGIELVGGEGVATGF